MSHQIGAPKHAWDAIRYFHAVALDFVWDLKKQFPNHHIFITPSTLSPAPIEKLTDASLEIEIQVWDRVLQLAFETFTADQFVPGLDLRVCGDGSLSIRPGIHYRLTLPMNADDPWVCWIPNQGPRTFDADFLLEQLTRLLAPLPH